MANQALIAHPDDPAPPIAIHVRAELDGSRLQLRYLVSGLLDEILLPPPGSSERADDLWRHSCFEVFLQLSDGYVECNFAPSRQWALYRFDGYRAGRRDATEPMPPTIETEHGEGRFMLTASLELGALQPLRLGLSSVIERRDGSLSYWALAHPPGRADFHHRDCFAVELPAAG